MSSSSLSSFHAYELQYCSLCDEYFHSKALLHQHMRDSSRHPRCETCKRSYLNMNSLRNHFVLSDKHHYCRDCDKSFASPAGLRVHLEQSSFHSDDDDDGDEDDGHPDGWEDELARLQDAERARKTEEALAGEEALTGVEADEAALSKIQRRAAMMNFMARRMRISPTHPNQVEAHSYNCPVCLSCPKTVSATRCGHLFCAPCIERAVDTSGVCPTCRKGAVMAHIRKVDLRVY